MSCCCWRPRSSGVSASAGTSSTPCRSTRAAHGQRGQPPRCSRRSRSWASDGRCGPEICCGRSLGKYGPSQALGWTYLYHQSPAAVPPIIIIATVSLISVLAGLVAAVVLLALIAVEALSSGYVNDALLMKNLTFYFGHMLVNISMYFGVAMVYKVMPAYTGRPWKTNALVVGAWNLTLLLVAVAYLHHLYMDFAQPQWVQVLGQLSSYLISIPASVVTIFSALVLVYGADIRWRLAPILLFLGVMGWAIGGVAAVIDSTVAVNTHFHNTLWVPAHFHTYYVMGVVLMILGVVFHLVTDLSRLPESGVITRVIVVPLPSAAMAS